MAAGAEPAGIVIALDRQERGKGELSAAQEVHQDYGIPCTAIAGLDDLIAFLEGPEPMRSIFQPYNDIVKTMEHKISNSSYSVCYSPL